MTCTHENFQANVNVNRLTVSDDDSTVKGFNADITVWCVDCDERFVFVGAPIGLMPSKPCISPDGTELRVPLRPQSSDPHFGMGLAGFIARVAEGSEGHDN